MFDFSGKVAVVTGAAGNVGLVVAKSFLECGASVAMLDRGQGRLQPLFDGIAPPERCHFAENIDLSSLESMQAVAAGVVERFGKIDILVHTVGGFDWARLTDATLDSFERMLDAHARTTFVALKAVTPHMLSRGSGKIVTMASRAAERGAVGVSAYSAAKAAALRLTESLAAEVKEKGINVNCVLPGVIDTEQNRSDTPDADYSRWVQPESLSDVILFLCSDLARDIHGAAIPVYGVG